MTKTLLASMLGLLLAGTAIAQVPPAATPAATAAAGKPQLGTFGFDVAGMDRSVKPGDDFYRFANGGWDAKTEIPADQSRWGGFGVLRDLSDQRTRDVLTDIPAGAPADAKKAATYYQAFMDEAAVEARGAAPLKPLLAKIDAIGSADQLAAAFAAGTRDGIDMPIGQQVFEDLKDNGIYTLYVSQGGLGLPDRDYYLVENNPKYAEARAAYKTHIANTLTLAGVADARAKAEAIFALETEIARVHWTRVESRQMEKIYNPVPVAQFAGRYPGFDWQGFLAAGKASGAQTLVITAPSAIEGTARLTRSVPLETWKAYLAFHTADAYAPLLSKAFVDENFAFRKVLSGTPQLKARWKRGVDLVNAGLGEAAGQLYVAKYFPPESKAKAEDLVKNLIVAMRGRLEKLEWMAPETKAKAIQKLNAFTYKIGYPDKWRDYAGLEVSRDDAFGNAIRATEFEYDYQVARVGKPVDKDEWGMTPQTVNAYANPPRNEIVFPAAILQPPFFDPNADDAVNYGGIGAVIGHEISHHFDDQGRKFDPTGSLNDWWTPQDVTRFKAYTDKVVAQYGAYEPLPGQKVNGELTLGENMADLAGITVAHDAWVISLKGRKPPVIDGFTGEQRFFLGFAQVWRTKTRDAALIEQLATDPHTPGNWRPYVVRNLDSWYTAFKVQPGTKYYLAPADRIKVW